MCVLQSRLGKAEKEISIHFHNKKTDETKLKDEIIKLKSIISSLKVKGVEASKTIQGQEKIVHNLEKKKKLIDHMANLKTSKNDLNKTEV